MGGSVDGVGGWATKLQASGSHLQSAAASCGPFLGSGTGNVLAGGLCLGMESTWQACGFQHRVRGPAFPGGMPGRGRLRRGSTGTWRGSAEGQALHRGRSRPVRYCSPGPLTRKQLCRKGPGGAGGHPQFVEDKLNTSLQCALVAAGPN